jgi:cobalamin biosynthesis Mg chelatase CobN
MGACVSAAKCATSDDESQQQVSSLLLELDSAIAPENVSGNALTDPPVQSTVSTLSANSYSGTAAASATSAASSPAFHAENDVSQTVVETPTAVSMNAVPSSSTSAATAAASTTDAASSSAATGAANDVSATAAISVAFDDAVANVRLDQPWLHDGSNGGYDRNHLVIYRDRSGAQVVYKLNSGKLAYEAGAREHALAIQRRWSTRVRGIEGINRPALRV